MYHHVGIGFLHSNTFEKIHLRNIHGSCPSVHASLIFVSGSIVVFMVESVFHSAVMRILSSEASDHTTGVPPSSERQATFNVTGIKSPFNRTRSICPGSTLGDRLAVLNQHWRARTNLYLNKILFLQNRIVSRKCGAISRIH